MSDKRLSEITTEDIEAARLAIEDELIDMRDRRMWVQPANRYVGHGLVVRESNGDPSSIIRLPTVMAIERAIKVILELEG